MKHTFSTISCVLLSLVAVAGCGRDDRSQTKVARAGNTLHSLRAEALTVRCPAPRSIHSTRIPTSFNAIYYAEAEAGIGFTGFDLAGLDPSMMSLFESRVEAAGGAWRLYCFYQDTASSLHLSLASDDSPRYESCRFEGGATSCNGTQSRCVFICPR